MKRLWVTRSQLVALLFLGPLFAIAFSALLHRALRSEWPVMDATWFVDRIGYGVLVVMVMSFFIKPRVNRP